MLFLDKLAKLSTVTFSYDQWLRGQRSTNVKFATLPNRNSNCIQHVVLGQTCKIVHCDLFIRPIIKGSEVNKSHFATSSNGKYKHIKQPTLTHNYLAPFKSAQFHFFFFFNFFVGLGNISNSHSTTTVIIGERKVAKLARK